MHKLAPNVIKVLYIVKKSLFFFNFKSAILITALVAFAITMVNCVASYCTRRSSTCIAKEE